MRMNTFTLFTMDSYKCPIDISQLDLLKQVALVTSTYVLLTILGYLLRRRMGKLWTLPRSVHSLFTLLAGVSAGIFLWNMAGVRGSTALCSPQTTVHTLKISIDVLFFLRILLVFGERYRLPMVATLVDSWLLLQITNGNHHAYTYHFLTLVRLLYPEVRRDIEFLAQLFTSRRGARWVGLLEEAVVIQLIVAGALQTSEEWRAEIIPADHHGMLSSLLTYWDYVYMSFVTLSTLGYGDMTPATVQGQVVTVCAIIFCVSWFVAICQELIPLAKALFSLKDEGNGVPSPPAYPRILLLGCPTKHRLQQLLDGFRKYKDEMKQILVFVSNAKQLRDLNQVSGNDLVDVRVVEGELDAQMLQKCFPDRHRKASKRNGNCVILMSDHETTNPFATDTHQLKLLIMIKKELPYMKTVVELLQQASLIAAAQIPGWNENAEVVCVEKVTVALLRQTFLIPGAASVLANMITPLPSEDKKEVICKCFSTLVSLYYSGLSMSLRYSKKPSAITESFETCALNLFTRWRIILIGYQSTENHLQFLPKVIPAGVRLLLLKQTGKKRNRTVTVTEETGALPSSALTLKTMHNNTSYLYQPSQPTGVSLFNLGRKRMTLGDQKRLVTNVAHGLSDATANLLGRSPHCCTTYVNPEVCSSVLSLAITHPDLVLVWLQLLQQVQMVEFYVHKPVKFRPAFEYLMKEERVLAVAALVRIGDWMCTDCFNTGEHDSSRTLAITCPADDMLLKPGNSIVALKLQKE